MKNHEIFEKGEKMLENHRQNAEDECNEENYGSSKLSSNVEISSLE